MPEYGTPHGLELMQGDGFGNLDASHRGTPAPRLRCSAAAPIAATRVIRFRAHREYVGFVFRTNPASLKNSDGSFSGVGDRFIQAKSSRTGRCPFRLQFGSLTVARASDTAATIPIRHRDLHTSSAISWTKGRLIPWGFGAARCRATVGRAGIFRPGRMAAPSVTPLREA